MSGAIPLFSLHTFMAWIGKLWFIHFKSGGNSHVVYILGNVYYKSCNNMNEQLLQQGKTQRNFKSITCSAPNDGILARTVPPAMPTQIKMPYVSGTQDGEAGVR